MERTIGDLAEEVPGAVRRKVEEVFTDAKKQAKKLKKKSMEDIWTGTTDYVKDNPGKTIMVSLAVGVVLGSLLRRGGSE